MGKVELPVSRAGTTQHVQECPVSIELLYSVVGSISNVYMTICIGGYPVGMIEFTGTGTVLSP